MEVVNGVVDMSGDEYGCEVSDADANRVMGGAASPGVTSQDDDEVFIASEDKNAGKDSMTVDMQPDQEGLTNNSRDPNTDGPTTVGDHLTSSYQNLPPNMARHNHENLHSSKKHVAWQSDREMGEKAASPVDRDRADLSPHCVNVDTLAHTPREETGLSCASRAENKGLRETDNILIAQEHEGLVPRDEIKGREGQHGREDLSGDHVFRTTGSTDTNGKELRFCPDPLVKRRPLSANTDRGRLSVERSLSEEVVRPHSAGTAPVRETRRLSLPLHPAQPALSPSRRTLSADFKTDRELTFRDEDRTVSVQDGEKQKKPVLVTYSEKERVQTPDTRSRDSPVGADKLPRPLSSKNAGSGKPRQRPHTAGQVQGRPRSSRPPRVRSAPASMGSARVWELPFSKDELQRALPRKNFFSCHNKALKDAGYDVEEENARPRRRRLFFFHREDDTSDTANSGHRAAAPPVIHVPSATTIKDEAQEDAEPGLDTAVQLLSLNERAKRRKSQAAQQVVECKPLQLYLSYVNDNPSEYRHMVAKSSTSGPAAALHPSSLPADNCHTARLVSMGRIFQERHGGPRRTDEVLRAVYSLNPRAADPHRFAANPQRDKSPSIVARKASTFPRKESAVSSLSGEEGGKSGQRSKPGSEMGPKHEAERPAHAEHLLEVEKRRLKAEEWARTVTTDQLVRAKLQVLRELGHEERELSQWWLAFRTCFYLRPPRIRE